MESKNRGFIVNFYTDYNGKQWTREQMVEKVLSILDEGGSTSPQMSRRLKIKSGTLNNILNHMLVTNKVSKERSTLNNINIFRKRGTCLLDAVFNRSAETVEEAFKHKIKSIQRVTVDQGTSKGFGNGGVDKYTSSSINSVYWDGE